MFTNLTDSRPEPAAKPTAKPSWLRVPAPTSREAAETRALMRAKALHTVCEEAACPNLGECWQRRHAAVMILGDVCTRACRFCNVKTGKPGAVDEGEPDHVAEAAAAMGLSHLVITSVDRDDLADGGAGQFAQTIAAVRAKCPNTTVEVLTPDFRGKTGAVETVMAARPDVFNHNLETVPRLYHPIRPGARYFGSLRLLARAKEIDGTVFTKSGLMLGLGETAEEVWQVMDDLRSAGVDFLTLGQYLRPTPAHAPIDRYVPPEEFADHAERARAKGFLLVAASPLTRSSYHADRDFAALREARSASPPAA